MKKRLLIIGVIIIVFICGLLIGLNLCHKDNVPKLEKLIVFGKEIDVVDGKKIYRVSLDKDYRTKDGNLCQSEIMVKFNNNSSFISIDKNVSEDDDNYEAYRFISFDEDNENFDYYIEVSIDNPDFDYELGCNGFITTIE